jgi:hypothetical protein
MSTEVEAFRLVVLQFSVSSRFISAIQSMRKHQKINLKNVIFLRYYLLFLYPVYCGFIRAELGTMVCLLALGSFCSWQKCIADLKSDANYNQLGTFTKNVSKSETLLVRARYILPQL